MLGWLRKKAPEQSEQTATGHKMVAIAEGLLSFQLAFIADEFDRSPASASDDFSLGYVAGFLDALMQRAGVQDETISFVMVSILMMKLFGEKKRGEPRWTISQWTASTGDETWTYGRG